MPVGRDHGGAVILGQAHAFGIDNHRLVVTARHGNQIRDQGRRQKSLGIIGNDKSIMVGDGGARRGQNCVAVPHRPRRFHIGAHDLLLLGDIANLFRGPGRWTMSPRHFRSQARARSDPSRRAPAASGPLPPISVARPPRETTLRATLPAPPSDSASRSTASTGTGASGEILETRAYRKRSSMTSPTTRIRARLNPARTSSSPVMKL